MSCTFLHLLYVLEPRLWLNSVGVVWKRDKKWQAIIHPLDPIVHRNVRVSYIIWSLRPLVLLLSFVPSSFQLEFINPHVDNINRHPPSHSLVAVRGNPSVRLPLVDNSVTCVFLYMSQVGFWLTQLWSGGEKHLWSGSYFHIKWTFVTCIVIYCSMLVVLCKYYGVLILLWLCHNRNWMSICV